MTIRASTQRASLAVLICAASAPAQLDTPDWVPSGNNIYFTGGNVSVGTTAAPYPLYAVGAGQAAVVGSTSTPAGVSFGVWGISSSTNGRGVYGYATNHSGVSVGGLFRCLSTQGSGVYAFEDAATGNTTGVRAQVASPTGVGVWGQATATSGATTGVFGLVDSTEGAGVFGVARSDTGFNSGVYGETFSPSDGFGVYSAGNSGGSGMKLFQIDHPLDPANRLLNHYSAEGPEPYLVYRGTVILDQSGSATVRLPDYFESINRDPQYQLTPIGAPASLYIAQEVVNNQFVISGGQPGMKVCWTVTGARNDAFVRRYGAKPEVIKSPSQRGTYASPELYGQPPSRALHQAPRGEDVEGLR